MGEFSEEEAEDDWRLAVLNDEGVKNSWSVLRYVKVRARPETEAMVQP